MFLLLFVALASVLEAQYHPALAAPLRISLSVAEARPQYGLDLLQDQYHAQLHAGFQEILKKKHVSRYKFGIAFAPATRDIKTRVYVDPEPEAPEEGLIGFLRGLPLPLWRFSRRC